MGEKEEIDSEKRVLEVVERETAEAVAGRGYKPWFTFGESRAFLVKVSECAVVYEAGELIREWCG